MTVSVTRSDELCPASLMEEQRPVLIVVRAWAEGGATKIRLLASTAGGHQESYVVASLDEAMRIVAALLHQLTQQAGS